MEELLPASPRSLSLLPLGGCGEFGRNCNVLFDGDMASGQALVVDCGGRFADEQHPGIDLLLPDLDVIQAFDERLLAYFLTHGHEDHIAALPHALQKNPAPIYASAYTLAHLQERLGEFRLEHIEQHVMQPGDRVEVGPFVVEAIAVSHSIPDSLAFAVHRGDDCAVFSGDFRIDNNPVQGPATDMTRMAELGAEGVQMLVGDSTGAQDPGDNPGERAVYPGLFEAITQSPGRAVVATFSSHLQRIQQVLDIASSCDRKVVFVGRSAQKHSRLGHNLDILRHKAGQIIDVSEALDTPAHQLVAVVTGCQGEPRAALTKMARGDSGLPQIEAGDRVIFSARIIPGNEKSVYRSADQLSRLGAEVIWPSQGVHISGHGEQGDMSALIKALRPHILVPVHGSRMHQQALAKIGQQCGLDKQHIALVDNGQAIEIFKEDQRWRYRGQAPLDLQDYSVDQGQLQILDSTVRAARHNMSERGLITVAVVVSTGSPRHFRQLSLDSAGVNEALMTKLLDALYQELDQDLRKRERKLSGLPEDNHDIHELCLASARRVFRRKRQRAPQILMNVIEL